MTIPRDTQMHLIGGTAALAGLLLIIWIWTDFSAPAALVVAGWLLGWGVERYQAIRREGTPERRDLLATAAPFWVAAAVLALYQVLT